MIRHRLRHPARAVLFVAILAACGRDTARQYPDSRRVEQTDDYHGVQVPDPYRWLEDLDAEETHAWVRAQNDLSRPYLESLPKREAIKERLTQLWNHEVYGIPEKKGNKYFYTYNSGEQNQDVLYVTTSLDGAAQPLIDPNSFREDATISLRRFAVSRAAKYIAYGLSDGGSDWTNWRVRDIATGEDLPDTIEFTKFTDVSWSADGQGFYYSRYPEGMNGKGDDSKPVAIYYHQVGTQQKDDIQIYALPDQPRQNPYGKVSHDGRYLIVEVNEGFQSNAIHVMALDGLGKVIRLFDQWDGLYEVLANRAEQFYVYTTKDAPLGRVVAVDITRPQPARWHEIIPETEETLESASFIGGTIATLYIKDAKSEARIYDLNGALIREVELPGVGTAEGFQGDPENGETFYSFDTFTAPPAVYRYDVTTGKNELFARSTLPGLDTDQYETKQVFFTSKDGTRIPMFITHRTGLRLNGRQPTLLYGYGGFNISLKPSFHVGRMAWVEMGGVLAIPNLRGGGEYGEAWHLAGTRARKQNVFDDFIAAAEWLIDQGYTSTGQLAIQGASNGGLLVAACLTQRPELFAVALPGVGVLDMLRYHLPSANARAWSSDYGLSENEDDFKALYAYSPYHNITPDRCYPATLITTADHDDRVVPWHSFKFCAALQHAQACNNPVLIRVETRAGHGAGTPKWMRIEIQADQWAFVVNNLKNN